MAYFYQKQKKQIKNTFSKSFKKIKKKTMLNPDFTGVIPKTVGTPYWEVINYCQVARSSSAGAESPVAGARAGGGGRGEKGGRLNIEQ